mmetsp:Transcript_22959/g.53713  ORF Transcript_22959/g.53713 Transcript_22959/m.53713 type:complete len:492 (-) Transcript_22959:61-1536(-)
MGEADSSWGSSQFQWVSRIKDTYSTLWKMAIRPPRDVYALDELGPTRFRLGKRVYERKDLQLKNCRGQQLECSHFIPAKNPDATRPCVIYLHGNCSSRLEAFDALPVLLPRDITVFSLDLSGSGRSEGEYISLGHHEEKDLKAALQHLRSLANVSAIGLWGRSMGAATAILCVAEDPDIKAVVLDSAFGALRTVAEELVSRGRITVPQFILNMAMELIRNEVRTRADFDPDDLVPMKAAARAECPALFAVAYDDSFVLPHHTQDLHNAWSGERSLRVFDGGHNGVRPTWFLQEAADFLVDRLYPDSSGGRRGVSSSASATAISKDGAGKNARQVNQPEGDSHKPKLPQKKRREEMQSELVTLGFDGELAAEAVHAPPQLVFDGNPSEGEGGDPADHPSRAVPVEPDPRPDANRSSDAGGAPLQVTSPRVQEVAAASPPSASTRQPPKSARVVDHLLYLGFSTMEAEEASRRALSVEAAVEWLASQRAAVQL